MNSAFTDRARKAVIAGYTMYVSVDLLKNDVVIDEDIDITDAGNSVTVDIDQSVRRTSKLGIADVNKYLPLDPIGPLSPFRTEIRIWSGVWYENGNFDRWAIFTGAIEDPEVDDNYPMSLTLTASDRAADINERRLSQSLVVPGGTLWSDAIQFIVNTVRPGITWLITSIPGNPKIEEQQIDELAPPWDACMDIAKSVGAEILFDGMGRGIARPIADPSTAPVVWTFNEDQAAVIIGAKQRITRKKSKSHAIVQGKSLDTGGVIRADAYDTDPSSPTYYEPGQTGGFGDRPIKLESELIGTQGQADTAAVALLNRNKGAVLDLSFTMSIITAFDEGDSVAIRRDRLGIDSGFVLAKFDLPLDEKTPMNPTTRSRVI